MTIIRKAMPEDAEAMTRIRAKCWIYAYDGIFEQKIIEENTNEEFIQRSYKEREKSIAEPSENDIYIVAVDDKGKILGFVSGGDVSEKRLKTDRELLFLYVDPAAHKQGLGRELMVAFAKECLAQNVDTFGLGCITKNKSTDFYKHLGGKPLFEVPGTFVEPKTYFGYSVKDFLQKSHYLASKHKPEDLNI